MKLPGQVVGISIGHPFATLGRPHSIEPAMSLWKPLRILLVGTLCLMSATAQASPGPPGDGTGHSEAEAAESLVTVRLLTDTAPISPGMTFHLAVVFDISEHWHIYWQDPGEAGAPTSISLVAPKGFIVGEPRFPRPTAFQEEIGQTYGYENQAVIFIPVTATADLAPGAITFHADIDYLVCREHCLIGSARRSLTLEITTDPSIAGPKIDAADSAILKRFLSRLPEPLDRLESAEARFETGKLTVTGPMRGFESVEFFRIEPPGIEYGKTEITVADGRFHIATPVAVRTTNAPNRPIVLAGVVALGSDPDDPCYHFETTFGTGAE